MQTGDFVKVSNERAFPSRDGSVYVEFLRNVGQVEGNCSLVTNDTHQINLINTRSGQVLNSFVIDRSIQGPLRLSPDGSRIAMRVAAIAQERCDTNEYNFKVSVFSTNGEELYRSSDADFPTEGIKSYDWHPDGRLWLVNYDVNRERFLIRREINAGTYRFEELGLIGKPDGTEINYSRFRIGPSGNDAVIEAVYDVAVAFSGFTKLFLQSDQERVNSPVFSPDGKHIMVTTGFIRGGLVNYTIIPEPQETLVGDLDPIILNAGTNSLSYVVPVGVMGQPMPPQRFSDNIRPVLTKHYSTGELSAVGFDPIDGYTWTPAID